MKTIFNYIGCKIIQAEAMDLDSFNEKFNKVIPAPMHTSKEGYHVQYPDGYDSWSPKTVFENAYRQITDDEITLIVGMPESETVEGIS